MAQPFPITDEQISKFLAHLAENGNVTAAAAAGGFCRAQAYEMRAENPEFKAKWEQAYESSIDALEQEARRRAFHGYEEDKYYKDQRIGTVKRYSDSLMNLLLKGNRSKYATERREITGADGMPLGTTLSREELAKLDDAELARQINSLVASDKSK